MSTEERFGPVLGDGLPLPISPALDTYLFPPISLHEISVSRGGREGSWGFTEGRDGFSSVYCSTPVVASTVRGNCRGVPSSLDQVRVEQTTGEFGDSVQGPQERERKRHE